ncbi:hypothetical protein AB1Y20_001285 [Prymnesium parvum]|uniref:Uncharacterized protein n=1 Tax=Prymnesium parvum TaxID=97485 RepID=A0AB34KAU3_PRYPA
MTRPDVAYYVSFLAGFNGGPTKAHRDAALSVLGYLVQTRELGITYGGSLKVPLGLREYPPGFVESRGLHILITTARGARPRGRMGDSTAEAETAVASKAAKETSVAMRSVSEDVGRCVSGPTVLFGDNKAAYDIIVKAGLTARTRYFERATLGVKRLYKMLLAVVPYLISTKFMVADILTKCTDKDTFYRMRDYMLNLENGAFEGKDSAGLVTSVWASIRGSV